MATPKQEAGNQRRDEYHHGDLKRALLRAASELLEEEGYEGFTLRKCAHRAGVSPSAPAHHFKDAAGLLNSLAVEGFGALSAILRNAFLKSHQENDRSCRGVATEYLQFAKKNPALYKVMFGSKLDADHPDLKAASQRSFEELELSVAEVFPHMTSHEVRALSLRMWASVHGMALLLIDNRLNFLFGESGYKNLPSLETDWLEAQTVPLP